MAGETVAGTVVVGMEVMAVGVEEAGALAGMAVGAAGTAGRAAVQTPLPAHWSRGPGILRGCK